MCPREAGSPRTGTVRRQSASFDALALSCLQGGQSRQPLCLVSRHRSPRHPPCRREGASIAGAARDANRHATRAGSPAARIGSRQCMRRATLEAQVARNQPRAARSRCPQSETRPPRHNTVGCISPDTDPFNRIRVSATIICQNDRIHFSLQHRIEQCQPSRARQRSTGGAL